jgi:hypothetical protein
VASRIPKVARNVFPKHDTFQTDTLIISKPYLTYDSLTHCPKHCPYVLAPSCSHTNQRMFPSSRECQPHRTMSLDNFFLSREKEHDGDENPAWLCPSQTPRYYKTFADLALNNTQILNHNQGLETLFRKICICTKPTSKTPRILICLNH